MRCRNASGRNIKKLNAERSDLENLPEASASLLAISKVYTKNLICASVFLLLSSLSWRCNIYIAGAFSFAHVKNPSIRILYLGRMMTTVRPSLSGQGAMTCFPVASSAMLSQLISWGL